MKNAIPFAHLKYIVVKPGVKLAINPAKYTM